MTNILDTLAASKLLAIYNHHSDKPVKRFIDSADGRKRLTKLLATIEVPVADAVAAVFPAGTDETWEQVGSIKIRRSVKPVAVEPVAAPTPLPELDALFQAAPVKAAPVKAEKAPRKPRRNAPVEKAIAKLAAKKAAAPVKPQQTSKATAKRAAKAAEPVETDAKAPTGAKATILAMIARKGGTSEKEVCAALGWVAAGATIGRAIKLAPFAVVKTKGDDGRTRYAKEG